MAEEAFENGTVVQLNSGGPLMTVDSFHADTGKYLCEWFVEGGERRYELFRGSSLSRYQPDEW
ncbi:YodC family protein [Serratia ureilytica]|uniref:YodC family protein n=1 Tax=Serratia ureilytica TaxID=300181 RepID=UPI00384A4968